jgi:pilus assembly protein CpaB
VVSAGLFVSPTATASGPAIGIPKGDVAVTVSVSAVQDVAGLVQPGDLVDILVLFQNKTERYLYQNAQVLAVGTTVAAEAGPPTQTVSATSTTTAPAVSNGLITFVVPPDAAARLAFIQSGGGGVAGSLYLTLVSPGNRPSAQAPVTSGDLIPATLSPK